MDARIGVLALQGNVSEHIDAFLLALERAGRGPSSEVFEVRSPADLAECNALAIDLLLLLGLGNLLKKFYF